MIIYLRILDQTILIISHRMIIGHLSNFYSSYRHSRKLNNKWAIGFGLTVDKVFRKNFKFNNNNNLDNNIRAEFQLSHRINKKHIGLGGLAKNHLIGIDSF